MEILLDLDPMNIASMGILSNNSLNIASDGFILLEEEIVFPTTTLPPIEPPDERKGGGLDYETQQAEWAKQKEHWKQFEAPTGKKIKATAFIGGKTFVTEVVVKDLTLSLNSVRVRVEDSHGSVKLKILLPEGVETVDEQN